jgi:hypothetical protein
MTISDAVLLAYLDDALSGERLATLEQAIRTDAQLQKRIGFLVAQRDSGMHSLGDIWRRHRLSCPTREQLGSYLLGAMLEPEIQYIEFHIETIGCRFCQANLEDLRSAQRQSKSSEPSTSERRKRIYHSSVGRIQSFPGNP